jgi:NADH-quinone oxidoreductase subunit J
MILFFSFIIILPIFILINNNPIYSLLALILTFINFSFVLFSVKLEFLALAYLIVYVGAICVLFIFVILLLNLRFFSYGNNTKNYIILLVIFCITILTNTLILNQNLYNYNYKDFCDISSHQTDLQLFAISFFVDQYIYFILAGFLLLLAIISCIYLTLSEVPSKKIRFYHNG